MSEYQCYEFIAIDRHLTQKEMSQLRDISTRAEITPTRFWNEYQWGDLKADPARLLARYFDAHFYFANWGTHRFMLRLPADHAGASGLEPYFQGRRASLSKADDFIILDFWSDEEGDADEEFYGGGRLAALTPIRSLLLQGDRRAAYLAWLCNVQAGEVERRKREPPVPPGLADLPASLSSLVSEFRIDVDLLAAAAEGSSAPAADSKLLRDWLKARPSEEKERWLLEAVEHPELALGTQIVATFQQEHASGPPGKRRSVAELLARAEQLRDEREAEEATARARTQEAAARAREKHLNSLATGWEAAWSNLAQRVDQREYEVAATLAVDLREVAQRDGKSSDFAARFEALKKAHSRRRGFFEAFKRKTEGW
ncbi:hypothetical protein [Hyalangium versicolor]|uniref:hypothetical protein n=1 Tax=Hyalangium versicolor TaxID=2861190 RepID=UPI001CCBB917|nr:hypothetical protein [Hyalangium versicolor]